MRSVKSVRRTGKCQIGKNKAKRKNNARKRAKERRQNGGKGGKWQIQKTTKTAAAEGSKREQKQQMKRTTTGRSTERNCVEDKEKREGKRKAQKESEEKEEKEKVKEKRSKEIMASKKSEEKEAIGTTLAMKKAEKCAMMTRHVEMRNDIGRKEEETENGKQMVNGVREEVTEKERRNNSDEAMREMVVVYGGESPMGTVGADQQQNGDTKFARNVHELVSAVNERMETQLNRIDAPKNAENDIHRPISPIKIEPLKLERISRRMERKERKPRLHKLLEMDIQYCEHMITKHGDNYEAMSRDPTNTMGDLPAAIQRKLRIYRDFIKQQQAN